MTLVCPVCRWPVDRDDLFVAEHSPEFGAWLGDGGGPRCPGSGASPGQLLLIDVPETHESRPPEAHL